MISISIDEAVCDIMRGAPPQARKPDAGAMPRPVSIELGGENSPAAFVTSFSQMNQVLSEEEGQANSLAGSAWTNFA